MNISAVRLAHLGIYPQRFKSPLEVVECLGAMQAQDFDGAKWAIGLRLPGSTVADIDQAIIDRQIVRTWPMRGTLHFVAAQDIRWMLKLMTPRVISGAAARRRALELDESVLNQAADLFEQALGREKILTRDQMLNVLEQNGISPAGQRGYHVLCHLSQTGLICFGPPQGKQQTFVLLEDCLPVGRDLSGDEALAEIAKRFFLGHGPATLADLARWTGLPIGKARRGLDQVQDQLQELTLPDGSYWCDPAIQPLKDLALTEHLLPGFDELILGYKDRSAVLAAEHAAKICPGNNGMFSPTMISQGQVVGTWKRQLKRKNVELSLSPFKSLSHSQQAGIQQAAFAYGHFLGLEPLSTELTELTE